MGTSTEATVLAALERAELAARERRLAASTEAERIITSARDHAATISAGADERIDEALEALKVRARSEADRAIGALERGAGDRSRTSASSPGHDRAFDRAAEMVVALVLGEGETS